MLPAHPPGSHLPDTGVLYTLAGSGRRNLLLDPHRYPHSYMGSGSRGRVLTEYRRPHFTMFLCFLYSAHLPPPQPSSVPWPRFHICSRECPWLLPPYLSHSAAQRSLEGSHTCICQCSESKCHHCDRGQRHKSLAFQSHSVSQWSGKGRCSGTHCLSLCMCLHSGRALSCRGVAGLCAKTAIWWTWTPS